MRAPSQRGGATTDLLGDALLVSRLLGFVLAMAPCGSQAALYRGNDGHGAVPVQRPSAMATEPSSPAQPTTTTTPVADAADGKSSPAVAQEPAAAATDTSPKPTSSPATVGPESDPIPAPNTPRSASSAPESSAQLAISEEAEPKKEPFTHAGPVLDFRIGTLGCIGGFCGSDSHNVRPGVRLGGFLGGNIRGWFEAGIGGGWGTMRSDVTPGTNALLLYGLDPNLLQQALAAQAAGVLNLNLAALAVTDSELRSTQVGPSVRVHFVPRGRFDAFVGTGVGYNLLRARYETALGSTTMDFHGIYVPAEANVSVYVHPNIAVGVQFDYMWTWYGVTVLDHPQQRLAAPLGVLEAGGGQGGQDFRDDLPQLWTLGLALRGRL